MEKIETKTPEFTEENITKLIELFPQVATEVENEEGQVERAIDFDALRDLLGDVAEGQRERYQFTWPGKREAKAEARRPIDKTMIPCPEKSVDWDTTENLYIEGDNLDALKLLRETYSGKIKIIYIDPPYNTGHDLIYDDDFAQSVVEYQEENGDMDESGGRLVSNQESNGRFHSDWCSMIYPRLLIARDLLTPDGAIFISIDEAESDNLRKICDEVFGAANFIAEMIWSGGRKNDSKYISVSHEYILIYAKSTKYLQEQQIIWRKKKDGLERIYAKFDQLKKEYVDDYSTMSDQMKQWYKNLPEDDPAKAHKHYSSIDANGIYFPDNISWPGGGGPKYDVLHPVTNKPVAIPSRGWLYGTPQRMQEMIDAGRVQFGDDETKVPTLKRYLAETEYEAPYSVIYKDGRAASKRLAELMGDKVFDNPKDVNVIKELLTYLQDDNCLVLDFFSGSGTTAESVMELNYDRDGNMRFILVQYPEDLDEKLQKTSKASAKKVVADAIKLCDTLGEAHELTSIAEERLKRAAFCIASQVESDNSQLKLDEPPKRMPDTGFRVFRIDSSNFKNTYQAPGQADQASLLDAIDNVKEGRTAEDILFQVLPAFRIPYSTHIEELDISGKTVFDVNNGQMLACFDADVTNDVIEEIARRRPSYAVMRDLSFKDDSAAANFEELFKTFSPDTIRRVI